MWDETLNRHQDYDFVVRYDKKYKLMPKIQPTVIFRYSQKARKIDFKSCLRFINRHIQDIEPPLYNHYNLQMLSSATHHNADDAIIRHYTKEATRYKYCLSFYQYISIREPDTWYQKIVCKLAYVFSILCLRID